MVKLYLLILFIISLINGCSSIDYSRRGDNIPAYEAPVFEQGVEQSAGQVHEPGHDDQQPKVITTAALQKEPLTQRQQKSTPASRQAVLDLLNQSKLAMEQYRYDEAENLLKRAIRIEPGNAWLWHNMAVLKFYQEDYQQAIQQALKSKNLEKNNPQLTLNNDKIIKQSRIELSK